jgi:hypothetical protein
LTPAVASSRDTSFPSRETGYRCTLRTRPAEGPGEPPILLALVRSQRTDGIVAQNVRVVGKDSVKNAAKMGGACAFGKEAARRANSNDKFLVSIWGLVEMFSASFRLHLEAGSGKTLARFYRVLIGFLRSVFSVFLASSKFGAALRENSHFQGHDRGLFGKFSGCFRLSLGGPARTQELSLAVAQQGPLWEKRDV